ncbi:MAG: hypothetical protein O2782_09500, partial [bacterium]|nr:hypothetical protein [bacterium]
MGHLSQKLQPQSVLPAWAQALRAGPVHHRAHQGMDERLGPLAQSMLPTPGPLDGYRRPSANMDLHQKRWMDQAEALGVPYSLFDNPMDQNAFHENLNALYAERFPPAPAPRAPSYLTAPFGPGGPPQTASTLAQSMRADYSPPPAPIAVRGELLPWGTTAAGVGRFAWPGIALDIATAAGTPGDLLRGAQLSDDEILERGFDLASTLAGTSFVVGPRGHNILGSGPVRNAVDDVAGTADVSRLWDDLSKTKLTRPVDEMSRQVVPAHEMLQRPIISPERLQGSVLQPLTGDRSAAGELLTGINETQLATPVLLEGGPDFMRSLAAQTDNAVWASNPGVVTRLQRNVNNAAREFDTDNINLVYTANGARNADFSTMTTDVILEQMPSSKILRKTVREFDRDMRSLVAGWPGVESKDLRAFLFSPGMGDARKAFVELAALGKYQSAGFPDIGSTRFAITAPGLLGEATGASGYAVARAQPDAPPLANPSVPHTTYPHQMVGEYLGGLE